MTESNKLKPFAEFPLVIEAAAGSGDALDWIAGNRASLLAQLASHGAVLLRGFALNTDQDFDRAVTALDLPAFTYAESLSNAVRKNRTEKVFTANEAPPEIEIYLHHEMAQTPRYPSKLFFFCEQAPDGGGATPLSRSDLLLAELKQELPDFASKCAEKGLRYTNVMPENADAQSGQGRSWRSTLNCEDRAQAEARLQGLGYQWQWLDDGSLKATTPVLPATKVLESGVEVFFNQLIAAFMGWKDKRNQNNKVVCFGDGEEITEADMQVVVGLAELFTFDLHWQNGDMALVDNFLVMHGRRPFSGERRVLASLAA